MATARMLMARGPCCDENGGLAWQVQRGRRTVPEPEASPRYFELFTDLLSVSNVDESSNVFSGGYSRRQPESIAVKDVSPWRCRRSWTHR